MFFSHNYARIKSGIYNSLTLEKTLTLHNTIILIKSVFKKKKNVRIKKPKNNGNKY